MSKWHGGAFSIGILVDASAFYQDNRGCFHLIVRSGDKLFHYVRGSKDPYPWDEGRQITANAKGTGQVEITSFGNLEIYWPKMNGDIFHRYADPLSFKDPSKPPHPVYPKFEKYVLHMIDMLAYAYNHPSWDPDPWVDRIAQTGASALQLFGWAGYPPQQYDIEAIPWIWRDGKVDFSQKNPSYEAAVKRIATSCMNYGIKYKHTLFLSRYNFPIFRPDLNHQGVRDFYTPEGLEIQKEYVLDVLRWNNEVGIQQPDVLLMNEPAHYGSDEAAHQIEDWHRIIGDLCLQHAPIKNVRIDSSHSEYAHAQYVGIWNSDGTRLRCPKSECGHKEMGREPYQKRPFQVEAHGCSTKKGFIENGMDITLNSAWPTFTGNEDGSDDGDKIAYNPDGSIAFRFASAEQYREALEYGKQREMETEKDVYVTGFPTGMLKLGEGDFSDLDVIDWVKYDLYKEIFG